MKKSSLGTGLSSLIPEKNKVNFTKNNTVNSSKNTVILIDVENISPNPNQPRYFFDDDNLKKLSQSIQEHGVVQPIIVTQISENKYELVAGERRLRASKLIGKKQIPAIVRQANNQEKLELAIIENTQRSDLNPIEEAKAYKKLKEDFNLTQESIAQKMGKNRATIANTMRLLDLPTTIQRGVVENKITEGHARAILSLENPEKQHALYELIIQKQLSVRETEEKAKEFINTINPTFITKNQIIDTETQELENILQQNLGTKVQIKKKNGKGRVVIDFFSEEEFIRIKDHLLR